MKRTIQQAVDIIQKIDIANEKIANFLLQYPQYACVKPNLQVVLETALNNSSLREAIQVVVNEAKDDEDFAVFKDVAGDRNRFLHKELERKTEITELFKLMFDSIAKHSDQNRK